MTENSPNTNIKVASLVRTCESCPSQWEGMTVNNRPIYIRYRWGYLSVRIGKEGGSVDDAVGADEVFGKQIGSEYSGCLSEAELLAQLSMAVV